MHTKKPNSFPGTGFTGGLSTTEDFLIFNFAYYSAWLPYKRLRWSNLTGTNISRFLALNSQMFSPAKYNVKLLNIMLK